MPKLDELAGLQVPMALPDTNPASPDKVLPKAADAALQGAATGARMAPMMVGGLAIDAATAGLGLPAWAAATAGGAGMGLYDKFVEGTSTPQALLDAALTGAGTIVGPWLNRAGKAAVSGIESRATAKVLAGAGEREGADAARRGSAAIGVELPAQSYVHPDRLKPMTQKVGLSTDDVQAINRDVQQRGNEALRAATSGVPTLPQVYDEITRVVDQGGATAARDAQAVASQYFKTLDPVERAKAVRAVANGNLSSAEATISQGFQQLDATNLGREMVHVGPLYQAMDEGIGEFVMPSQASRLSSMAGEAKAANTPSAAVEAGGRAKAGDLQKTVVPMPSMEDQRKGTVTDVVRQVDDFLKGEGKVRRSQRISFKDEAGVTHTTEVSGEFVSTAPKADPNEYMTFDKARRLRSELLAARRARPDESDMVSGQIEKWINTLDEQMTKAGESLKGTDRAAYDEWRTLNDQWRKVKDVRRDAANRAILDGADSDTILNSITKPDQVDRIKALLTDQNGQVSPKIDELKGTLLQRVLDKNTRPDGTYDAAKVSQDLFGDENKRAVVQRLFTPDELNRFGDSLVAHQTATDLRAALGTNSMDVAKNIAGMDLERARTLWTTLDQHPNVQSGVRGALLADYIGATKPGSGMVSGDDVLKSIGRVHGLDPRHLELMFPSGSGERAVLERAADVGTAMRIAQETLAKGKLTKTDQFLEYLKRRTGLAIGAGVVGASTHAIAGPGIMLGGELLWRTLKSQRLTTLYKATLASPITSAVGTRATAMLLSNLLADPNVGTPDERAAAQKQLDEATAQLGNPDPLKLRLQSHEQPQLPNPTYQPPVLKGER